MSYLNAPFFVSAEITGSGSSQNTAHGLGRAPRLVVGMLTGLPAALTQQSSSMAEGAHDSTNCKFTVTNNVSYRIVAWL